LNGWALHGNSKDGADNAGKKTNVLNIYGAHKMHQIGANIPTTVPITAQETALQNLLVPNATDNYAQFEYNGKVHYSGALLEVGLNFTNEIFMTCTVPYYKVQVDAITQTDLTAIPNANWNQFLAHFDGIMTTYDLDLTNFKEDGIGDIGVYLGWTKNNDDSEDLDFIDATIKIGGLLGNAKKKNPDKIFSLAGGYDGHHGFVTDINLAMGSNERLALEIFGQYIYLFKRNLNVRMQTALGQNGFIKLLKGAAQRNPGNLYQFGGRLKFDAMESMTFSTGYHYAHQSKTTLAATDSVQFPTAVVNDDSMLADWSMHVFHVGMDLDFTHQDRRVHPRAGISYQHVVKARNAFLNHSVGGNLGLSVTFNF
jgi:hypothetical protein